MINELIVLKEFTYISESLIKTVPKNTILSKYNDSIYRNEDKFVSVGLTVIMKNPEYFGINVKVHDWVIVSTNTGERVLEAKDVTKDSYEFYPSYEESDVLYYNKSDIIAYASIDNIVNALKTNAKKRGIDFSDNDVIQYDRVSNIFKHNGQIIYNNGVWTIDVDYRKLIFEELIKYLSKSKSLRFTQALFNLNINYYSKNTKLGFLVDNYNDTDQETYLRIKEELRKDK